MLKSILVLLSLLLCTPVFALDLTLQWDANTESDLAGYKVYYKIDGPGVPYDGTGATAGSSPIVVLLSMDENPDPDVVEYTVTGLPNTLGPMEKIRFVVTAFNNVLMESGFSNEADKGAPTNPGNLIILTVSFP